MSNVLTEKEKKEERIENKPTTADVAKSFERPEPTAATAAEERTALIAEKEAGDFRTRWDNVQTSFVDEPRKAVERADSLVAEVMQHLARTFADERKHLEDQWGRGDNVSTEDLRIALQRYRSFFSRLLSV